MINLTRSPNCSASQFINLISYKLPHYSKDALHSFLADLPADDRGNAFKVVICDRFLFDKVKARSAKSAPRPQARRARPLQAATSSENNDSPSEPTYPWSMPSTSRISQYFSSQPSSNDSEGNITNCIVKFHLFASFAIYKRQDEEDREWRNFIGSSDITAKLTGTFKLAADDGTWGTRISDIRDTLLDMMEVL